MRVAIFFMFVWTQVLGQINSDHDSHLFSKGETPEFLKEYQSRFYLPQSSPWIKGIKKNKKAFYLDQVYASNMIVFGDPISEYCSQLLEKITSNKYSVYLVRSNVVSTFSDSNNIFITSGLISKLSNEAQLMFYLTRETEVIKGNIDPLFKKTKRKVSLNNAITELSSFPQEVDLLLDKKAFDKIKSKKLYTDSELYSAFDVLKYQNRPFYEHSFDITYFNNENSYIPESKFFLIHKPNPEEYDYKSEFPDLEKRISEFPDVYEPSKEKTFLNDKDDFKNIVKVARHESVVLNILKAEFVNAIYEIYVLEKFGYKSTYLGKLKASAWWGYLNQEAGNFELQKYNSYQLSDSKGAVFMRFIRMQTKLAKITLGLRTLKDLKKEYPESRAISRMYEDLISIAAETAEFNLESYYKTNLKTAINQFKSNDSLRTEDDRLLDAQAQELKSKGVDSVNYHLFMLPDLMKSDTFLQKYESFKSGESQSEGFTPKTVAISDFSLVKYKKKKIQEIEDSEAIIEGAYSIANDKTDIAVSTFYSAEKYNLNYLINSVYIQNYHYNDYKKLVQSPFSDELAEHFQSAGTDAVGVSIFEQAYEPRYRPFHLLGLLGVTLPYIVPEFFLSGNKTIHSSLYFDVSNGNTVGLTFNRFNDPFNKRIIQHSFLESLLITFSNDE